MKWTCVANKSLPPTTPGGGELSELWAGTGVTENYHGVPITDVLNVLPQAPSQIRFVSLCVLSRSLGASTGEGKRVSVHLTALETHSIFAEDLSEGKGLRWGPLALGRGESVGSGFMW